MGIPVIMLKCVDRQPPPHHTYTDIAVSHFTQEADVNESYSQLFGKVFK
jgi:hypothetical protein